MKVKQSNLITIKKLSQYNSFFHGFSKESLNSSLGDITIYHYQRNETIFRENEQCNRVYFIIDGCVKFSTHNLKEKILTLNIVGKDEIMGEISFLEAMPHSADAISLTETTVMTISLSNFLAFLQTETLAIIRLAQLLAKRLRQANQLLKLRNEGSYLRLAGTLLLLAESLGFTIEKKVYIPNVSRHELASITGLSPETISRVLSKLKQNCLIVSKTDEEKIYIPNLNALKKIINRDMKKNY